MQKAAIEQFKSQGNTLVRGLFKSQETAALRDHYMSLRENGAYPGDFDGVDATSSDPLKRYPRMIHMHRWDDISMRWMLDARFNACMTARTLRGSDHALFQAARRQRAGSSPGPVLFAR